MKNVGICLRVFRFYVILMCAHAKNSHPILHWNCPLEIFPEKFSNWLCTFTIVQCVLDLIYLIWYLTILPSVSTSLSESLWAVRAVNDVSLDPSRWPQTPSSCEAAARVWAQLSWSAKEGVKNFGAQSRWSRISVWAPSWGSPSCDHHCCTTAWVVQAVSA